MEYWDYVAGTVVGVALGGLLVFVGVLVGGLFVLRTKRDGYEPLIPPLHGPKETVALNVDDLMESEDRPVDQVIENILKQRRQEDPVLQQNARFKEQNNG